MRENQFSDTCNSLLMENLSLIVIRYEHIIDVQKIGLFSRIISVKYQSIVTFWNASRSTGGEALA